MSNVIPIAVTQTGFSWTAVLLAVANLLIGGVLVALIKSRPALKKLTNDREANLLTERAQEMERMRARVSALESRLEEQEVKHEAERSVDRHRINNLQSCLDAFLMLIEATPNQAAEVAVKIRDKRAKQSMEEAAEKSAIQSAKVMAAKL